MSNKPRTYLPGEVESNERFIIELKANTGRSCGSCSLCCRLLNVPEAGKPEHGWCPHCRPGKGGCSIYPDRPNVCRTYACHWLIDDVNFNDDWFPQKSRIVPDFHIDDETKNMFLRFHIDPRTPNRWREEPYYSHIKKCTLAGLLGKIVKDQMIQTVVSINGEWTLIMPTREFKYAPGMVMRTGDTSFEFVPCKSNEAVKELQKTLGVLHEVAMDIRASHPEITRAFASNPMAALELMGRDPRIKKMMGNQTKK